MRSLLVLAASVALLLACLQSVTADYAASQVQKTDYGLSAQLDLIPGTAGPYGGDISRLSFQAFFETADTLRIRIADPNAPRWEVPFVVQSHFPGDRSLDTLYTLDVSTASFGFVVRRAATGEPLFDSTGLPLVVRNH